MLLIAVVCLGICLWLLVCANRPAHAVPSHTHDWTGSEVCNHPPSSYTESATNGVQFTFNVRGNHFAKLKYSGCSNTRQSSAQQCDIEVHVRVVGQKSVDWELGRCNVTGEGTGTTSHETGKHSGTTICYAHLR
jgi:hypothetical protein